MIRIRGIFAALLIVALGGAGLPALADNGRIPIPFAAPVTTPIVIDQPGSYVLTRDLAATGPGAVLSITARGVTVDLDGKSLSSAESSPVISIGVSAEAVIRNGFISGGTNGVASALAADVTLEDLHVSGSLDRGIFLSGVERGIVRRTTVEDTGNIGIALEGSGGSTHGIVEDNELRRTASGICVFNGGSVEVSNNRLRELTAGTIPGGIIVEAAGAVLVKENLLQDLTDINAINIIGTSRAVKLVNNLIEDVTNGRGIVVSASGGLILDNVVHGASAEGILIQGDRNQLDRNTTTENGSFGIRFSTAASDNIYRRTVSRGNNGDINDCVAFEFSNPDFCDDLIGASGNSSSGDNYVPSPL